MSAAAAAGLVDPLLWITLPTAVDLVGALREQGTVYYCCDDFGALAGVDHRPVLALERELGALADLVLVTNPRLAHRFDPAKTRLLPHGVDFERFATPVAAAPDLPQAGPVAGFYGSLADWVDTELLAGLARRLPHGHFFLIGEVQTAVEPLAGLSNLTLAGPRRHDQLPAYAQHWTASLLPFRDTEQIRSSNPLKLREYLAAGRPVVSTDFPALDGYRPQVAVAAGIAGFAEALEAARREVLGGDALAATQARRALVAGESWAVRAAQASEWLDALDHTPDGRGGFAAAAPGPKDAGERG